MFKKNITSNNSRLDEFSYLSENDIYMDAACQSLRPQPVIDALNDYYHNYNACGDRVKYQWGQKVDAKIDDTREKVLNFLGLSKKDYVCSFTLNTTYGLNLILSQLPCGRYDQIITSEIEHNSVFLTTIELAKRLKIPRHILNRKDDGALEYKEGDLSKAIVVVNSMSNIDGRLLNNIKQLIKDAHKAGGIVIIDAAQAMAHCHDIVKNVDADAICFSAHKMYGSSLGAIVIKKDLLKVLKISVVGGGMVTGTHENSYDLLPDDMSSWLEPGLQAYGEIIALGAAIDWLNHVRIDKQKPADYINKLSQKMYDGLSNVDGLELFNKSAAPVISVYSPKIDSHRLAIFLSGVGIMVRSGYFCCHYYLIDKLNVSPMARFSIGLHTTEADVDKVISNTKKFIEEIK